MFLSKFLNGWRHYLRSVFHLPSLLAIVVSGGVFLTETGVQAQNPAATDSQPSGPAQPGSPAPAEETPENQEQQAMPRVFGEPAVDIPYSSIFRNTDITATSISGIPTLSPSIQANPFELQTDLGVSTRGLRIPLIERGFDPENANLKLGPVYFRFPRLQTGLLYTDNENQTETDRKPGWIGIVYLDTAVVCQLTEGLQLAVSGALVYLPLQGKFGPAGYGLIDALGLGSLPILKSQATYETMLEGWDVQLFDDVTAAAVIYSNGLANLGLSDGADFPWQDRAGIYVFSAPYEPRNSQSTVNFRTNDNNNQIYFSNRVGFQGTRLLPDDVRLSVSAFHENLWYNQNGRGLPNERDYARVLAQSESENLRFKPFAFYEVSNTTPGNNVDQKLVAGAAGPVTDQLNFYGYVGTFLSNNSSNLIWQLQLAHDAGPNTRESLYFGRTTDTFNQEIVTDLTYNINQTLGPSLAADFYGSGRKVQNLNNGGDSFNELLGWVRLTYFAGARTDFRLSGYYDYQVYPYDVRETISIWTGRCELNYHFTDTLSAQLFYQYQNRSSNLYQNGYYQNLVMLTLIKYFQ